MVLEAVWIICWYKGQQLKVEPEVSSQYEKAVLYTEIKQSLEQPPESFGGVCITGRCSRCS